MFQFDKAQQQCHQVETSIRFHRMNLLLFRLVANSQEKVILMPLNCFRQKQAAACQGVRINEQYQMQTEAGIQINRIFNIDIAIFQKINIDIDIAQQYIPTIY